MRIVGRAMLVEETLSRTHARAINIGVNGAKDEDEAAEDPGYDHQDYAH